MPTAWPPTPGTGQQTTWTARAQNATFSPAAITVTAGDLIIAYATTEDANYSATIADTAGNSWNLRQDVNAAAFARVQIWTATANATGSTTITFTRDSTVATKWCGGAVRSWSDTAGVGASAKTNNASGAPSLNLATSERSAITVISADWSALDGANRLWRLADPAGTFTEATYERDAAAGTSYSGYHSNSGVPGTKTVGLSAPGAQKYSIVALEILGTQTQGVEPGYSAYPKAKLRRS